MKKVFAGVFAVILGIMVIAPEHKAEAQVVTRQCCDANGVVRCMLINWTPVGNSCFCYGQGYGVAC